MMEMHTSSYLGRPSSINRNRYQQHHPSMESAPAIWQQRQRSELDGMLSQHQHILSADINDIDSGSMRGAGVCSSKIPRAILGSSSRSIQATQSSSSELYDTINSSVQFVDSNDARYSLLLSSTTMASSNEQRQQSSSSVGGGASEGPMICGLIGKLGGSTSGGFLSSDPAPSQQRLERGVDSLTAAVKFRGAAGNHCWNSTAIATARVEMPSSVGGGLTVDPSEGELPLNHGAVVAAGLATSHCLSPFTADPGFADRAARFSSFSNGNSAQAFPSDSESVGPARSRTRSGASQPSPRNSSCLSLQQETVRRAISNDSAASERLPDSRTREIQSDGRAVLVDLVASGATINNDDNTSLIKQHYAQVDWNPASEKLSRTVSNLMGSGSNGEDRGEELQRNISIDASSDRMQATSFPSEQVNSEGAVELCPSPSGRSSAMDISVKKRKPNFEERQPSKQVGSGSAFPHHDKDAKTTYTEEAKGKRVRRRDGKEDMRGKADRTSSETSGESSPRPTKEHSKPLSEHPKTDYIHVRARRGQATDSHSLAERVRREKISERMKFLQDLVPGCSKVTGKAVMLDEIINYVQSLQRQVEFLSMKLASMNPRLDSHQESFLAKEGPHPVSRAMVLNADTSVVYPPLQPLKHRTPLQQGLEYQLHAEAAIRRSMNAMPIVPAAIPREDNSADGPLRQAMWDDGDSDLNSIVQMGFGNSHATSSQGLQCHLPPGQVKVELQQPPITCL